MTPGKRLIALAVVSSSALAGPVAGWEFGQAGAEVFYTGTRDSQGETQLVFFCTQASPGIVQLQLFTTERGPATPVDVELFITTSADTFGPIAAKATSRDGNLTVATVGMDWAAMNAAQSVYASAGEVTVRYYESNWRYEAANYSESFGAMLDACG